MWTVCSHSCGKGLRMHMRQCMFGAKGLEGCLGPKKEYEPCNVEVRNCGGYEKFILL